MAIATRTIPGGLAAPPRPVAQLLEQLGGDRRIGPDRLLQGLLVLIVVAQPHEMEGGDEQARRHECQ